MRVVTKLSLAATLITASFSLSAIAQAHDYDRDHDRRGWEHRHYVHERHVVVHERPVFVERERPVYVAPPVVYSPPGPSGLNLNFNIPLN